MAENKVIAFNKSLGILNQRHLHMEISSGCNIRCPMCTFHDNNDSFVWMPFEKVRLLQTGLDYFGYINIGDGSEPLINPDWEQIVRHLTDLGPKVALQTNAKKIRTKGFAERIVRSGLHGLSISVDGITDNTVSRIRKGTTFSAISEAIEHILAAKQSLDSETPYLYANCVAMGSNLEEIPELVDFLINKGFIRIRIGFLELRKPNQELIHQSLIYYKAHAFDMIRDVQKRTLQSGKNVFLDIDLFGEGKKRERTNACTVYNDRIYVRYDGDMFACYGKRQLGNIFIDGIDACIASKEYTSFVDMVKQPDNQICQKCSFCRNMSIDDLSSHFGLGAADFYTWQKIEESIKWVMEGGSPREYWSGYYSNIDEGNHTKK